MIFFDAKEFFFMIYFKNGCENDLTIITKNHAADPELGFLAKSISKTNGYATVMPTAWELKSPNHSIRFISEIHI